MGYRYYSHVNICFRRLNWLSGLGLSLSQPVAKGPSGNIPAGAIVVSGAAYGGYAAGNDTTGTGTTAKPYATLVKALTVVTEGGKIVLNGNPSSPTVYAATTIYSITKGITIDSIFPWGATLRATGAQTRVMNLAPTAGQTINFGKIIIDGASTIANCVLLNDNATKYKLIAAGTKFINWTTQAVSATSSATATKVDLTVDSCTFTATGARSAVWGVAFSAGDISIKNSTISISNQSTSGHGGVVITGNAIGPTFEYSNNTLNMSVSTPSGTSYGVKVLNIPNANINHNTFTANGTANNGGVEMIQICALSSAPLSSSGGYVGYNVINHQTNGGMGIEIGEDNQDSGSRGYQNGATVEHNTIICNTLSQTGATHGLFSGSGANTVVRNNLVVGAAFGIADKECDGVLNYNNLFVSCGTCYLRLKAVTNSTYKHNTCVKDSSGTGIPIQVTNNQTNLHTGNNNIIIGNILYSSVATTMVNDDGTNTNMTYGYNDYYTTAGLSTNPWNIGATNYASLAAWQAVETTAVGINPQFADIANKNYDIAHAVSGLDIVPADANIISDYLGRAYASPATIGAYQRQ